MTIKSNEIQEKGQAGCNCECQILQFQFRARYTFVFDGRLLPTPFGLFDLGGNVFLQLVEKCRRRLQGPILTILDLVKK